jgi:hypothetical protein
MGSDALNDRRAGTDVVLTNLSIGIPVDQDLIGDSLLPSIPVKTSVVKIPVWGNEAFRIREDRVGDYGEPDKLDISVDTTLLEVDGHALEAPVSDRHEQEAAQSALSYDLKFEALQTIVSNMRLAREKMQADLLTSTAVYTTASHKKDLNGLSRLWSDNTVDPLEDIIPMLESTVPDDSMKRPNVFWMGQPVWAALMQNTKILDRLYGQIGPRGVPKPQNLADLLGIDRVAVGRAISKTAGGVNTKLWGKNAGLLWVAPTAGKRMPSFGYTVEQTVFGSSAEKVITYRKENMGASGGDIVKRSAFFTPTATFVNSGSLFYNAVA